MRFLLQGGPWHGQIVTIEPAAGFAIETNLINCVEPPGFYRPVLPQIPRQVYDDGPDFHAVWVPKGGN